MDWPSLEPPRSIWSGFGQKIAIFGALDAWIGAWNWQKWPQAILSHQLGCDMAHQALSRWTGLAWSHPGPFGPDLAKKIAIFGALDAWIGAWNWKKRLPHQWSYV